MPSDSPAQETVSPAPEYERAVFFIGAFYSLIRLATCSRVGSVLIDQAATGTIQLLRDCFPTAATVSIELTGDTVVLDGRPIALTHEIITDFYRFFSLLEISSLRIERNIPHRLLLQFVKTFLAWRLSVLRDPAQLNKFPEISGVEVVRETPNGPAVSQVRSASRFAIPQTTVEAICSELRKGGVAKSTVLEVRDHLFAALKSQAVIPAPSFPYLCWRDAIVLLYKSATWKRESEKKADASITETEFRSLVEFFEVLNQQTSRYYGSNLNKVLVEYLTAQLLRFNGLRAQTVSSIRKKQRRKADVTVSIAAIKQFVNEYKIPSRRLDSLLVGDHCEVLAVVLQRLEKDCPEKIEKQACRILQGILSEKINQREWNILIGFLAEHTESGDQERFDWLFRAILKPLRAAKNRTSLECCVDLWPKLSLQKQILVWPHVVNELLLSGMDKQKPDMFFSATGIASHQPLEIMQNCREKLEQLEVWRENKLAEMIFRTSYIYSYPLFSFLLTTSIRDLLAEKIITELKEEPQDQFMEVVSPFIRPYKEEHIIFVRNYLAHSRQEELSGMLKSTGSRILLNGLEDMNDLTKKKPWVVKAIAGMADYRVEGTRDMLERIRSEKRIGLLPAWPKECRKAAEGSLQHLMKIDMRLEKESAKYNR